MVFQSHCSIAITWCERKQSKHSWDQWSQISLRRNYRQAAYPFSCRSGNPTHAFPVQYGQMLQKWVILGDALSSRGLALFLRGGAAFQCRPIHLNWGQTEQKHPVFGPLSILYLLSFPTLPPAQLCRNAAHSYDCEGTLKWNFTISLPSPDPPSFLMCSVSW